MRFSIAAGILAVSLPSDAHVARTDLKKRDRFFGTTSSSTFSTDGDRLDNKSTRRNRLEKRRAAIKSRGLLLKNGKQVECKPESLDVDVGVLGCGLGQYCQESQESALGGFCVSSTLPAPVEGRTLQEYGDEDYEFDPTSYCDYEIYCDCYYFDNATTTGTISCGPSYECYEECEPALCVTYALEINFYGSPSNYTASYCKTFLTGDAALDRSLCYNSDYTLPYGEYGGFVGGYIGGVKCSNFTYTYSSETGYCYLFDCSNTAAGIASVSCFDGVDFVPEEFYDNCTDTYITSYVCSPCGAGSYGLDPYGNVFGYSCSQIAYASYYNLVSPDDCGLVGPMYVANCGCSDMSSSPPTDGTSTVPATAPPTAAMTSAPPVAEDVSVPPSAVMTSIPTAATGTTPPSAAPVGTDPPTATAVTPEPTPAAEEETPEPTVEDDDSGSSTLSTAMTTVGLCASVGAMMISYFMG